MTTEILFIRHGETDWNREGRIQGQSDIPLNEWGVWQAQTLAEKLKEHHFPIHAIYSSDLDRAYKTALPTAEKLQLPIITSSNFREINYGSAEGLVGKEKNKIYREVDIPGAESYDDVLQRAKKELLNIVQNHRGEKIAIFSHGRTINLLIAHVATKEPTACSIANCTLAKFTYHFSSQTLQFITLERLL